MLYVILAVVAVFALIIAFVLLSPLQVKVVYKDTLSVYAGISFIKFKVLPKKEKKNKKKKTKTESNKQKSTPNKAPIKEIEENIAPEQKNSKKKPLKETLSLVFDIVKSFFDMLGKKAKIEIDELCVVVSKPDAADTAVQFGICNGIVVSLLALADSFGKAKIRHENISVSPDFILGKSTLCINITLSAPAGSILWSVVRGYLKNQFKK